MSQWERETSRRGVAISLLAGMGLAAILWEASQLSGCAHVAAPPGGPPDKIPPYVSGVYPAPQQAEVPRDAAVIMQFSEWVKGEALQGQITLSPTLPGQIRLNADGDKIVLKHDTLFRENTTYRLVIPTQLKDMHDNSLDSVFELVFSTGKELDSGVIQGRLFQIPGGKLQSAWAALYSPARTGLVARRGEKRKPNWPDTAINAWREKPTYLSPIDSTGHFRFGALPPGNYAVLGFIDANHNQLPDNGETGAIGPGALRIGTTTLPELNLRAVPIDTQVLRMTKVTWVPAGDSLDGRVSGALQVGLSRPLGGGLADWMHAFLVSPADIQSKNAAFRTQPEAVAVGPTGDLELWFNRLPVGERLVLRVAGLIDERGLPLDTARASLAFEPTPVNRTLEALKWSAWVAENAAQKPMGMPKESRAPFTNLLLRADRPFSDSLMNDAANRVQLRCDSLALSAKVSREGPFGMRVAWSAPTSACKSYVLSMTESRAQSMDTTQDKPAHGAKPSERTLEKWTSLEKKGWGSLQLTLDPHLVGWMAVLRREKSEEVRRVRLSSANAVHLDSLTPGVWRVSAFTDQNGNGRWDAGLLKPWIAQEPSLVWSDSLVLEAGQETGPFRLGPGGSH